MQYILYDTKHGIIQIFSISFQKNSHKCGSSFVYLKQTHRPEEFVFELLFFVGLVVGVVFDQVEAFGEVPGLAGVEVRILVDKVDG